MIDDNANLTLIFFVAPPQVMSYDQMHSVYIRVGRIYLREPTGQLLDYLV